MPQSSSPIAPCFTLPRSSYRSYCVALLSALCAVQLAFASPAHADCDDWSATRATEAPVQISKHEALAIYSRCQLSFDDIKLVTMTGFELDDWSEAVQGDDRTEIGWEAFYRTVGRDDLASRYVAKRNLRLGLLIGSSVVLAAGVGMAVYGATSPGQGDCAFPGTMGAGCMQYESDYTLMWTGIGVGAAGTLLWMIAWYIEEQPISARDARALARSHNTNLRMRLQRAVGSQTARSTGAEPASASLSLQLQAGPTVAGMGLRGVF